MAYTADGVKIEVGMTVYDRVLGRDRKLIVYEIIDDNSLRINDDQDVLSETVYSSLQALSDAHKILIFGGTFNPIHNGHLIAARIVAEELNINKVILIPSGKHPYKHDITECQLRLEMANLALEEDCGTFSVCDCEFNRERYSYSVDTAKWIKHTLYRKMEEVYWLIGSDNVYQIPSWYRADELVKEVRFVVASRRNDCIIFNGTKKERKILDKMHITYVDTPIIEISSSMIRERIKQGKSIKYLVPDTVEEFIYKNNLYR